MPYARFFNTWCRKCASNCAYHPSCCLKAINFGRGKGFMLFFFFLVRCLCWWPLLEQFTTWCSLESFCSRPTWFAWWFWLQPFTSLRFPISNSVRQLPCTMLKPWCCNALVNLVLRDLCDKVLFRPTASWSCGKLCGGVAIVPFCKKSSWYQKDFVWCTDYLEKLQFWSHCLIAKSLSKIRTWTYLQEIVVKRVLQTKLTNQFLPNACGKLWFPTNIRKTSVWIKTILSLSMKKETTPQNFTIKAILDPSAPCHNSTLACGMRWVYANDALDVMVWARDWHSAWPCLTIFDQHTQGKCSSNFCDAGEQQASAHAASFFGVESGTVG